MATTKGTMTVFVVVAIVAVAAWFLLRSKKAHAAGGDGEATLDYGPPPPATPTSGGPVAGDTGPPPPAFPTHWSPRQIAEVQQGLELSVTRGASSF